MIMLVHPETGDVETIKWGDDRKRELFEQAVLDGYVPVGPQCQKRAEEILRRAAEAA